MKKYLIIPTAFAFAFFAFIGINYANAQTVNQPSLLVDLVSTNVAPTLVPGAQNVTVANIRLDAVTSSDNVRLSNLPIIVATGNNASASSLTACRLVNSASPSTALNTGNNVSSELSSGANTFTFDNTLTIPRGTTMNLLLNCNIASSLASGGTYQFSINTSNVVATAATTGLPVVVGVTRTTTPTVPPVIPPVIPGIPNTGFGGNATTNILVIFGSMIVAGLGLAYTRKLAR